MHARARPAPAWPRAPEVVCIAVQHCDLGGAPAAAVLAQQQLYRRHHLLRNARRHGRRVQVRGAVAPQVRDQLLGACNVAARRAKRLGEGACSGLARSECSSSAARVSKQSALLRHAATPAGSAGKPAPARAMRHSAAHCSPPRAPAAHPSARPRLPGRRPRARTARGRGGPCSRCCAPRPGTSKLCSAA